MNICNSGGGVTGICCVSNGNGMDVAMIGDVGGYMTKPVYVHTGFASLVFRHRCLAEASATLSPQSGLSVGTCGSSRGLEIISVTEADCWCMRVRRRRKKTRGKDWKPIQEMDGGGWRGRAAQLFIPDVFRRPYPQRPVDRYGPDRLSGFIKHLATKLGT